jgi:hypothetical protein
LQEEGDTEMSLKNEEKKGIRAIFIFEIIGKPKEHLVETLNQIIDAIDKEKGVRVAAKEVKEPIELKENKEFFTTFAEIEVEIEEVLMLAGLMFKYMPAHIEVIEPEIIALSNNGWSEILSELTRKLHGYDEVARILQTEKAILENKLRSLLPEKKNEAEAEEPKEEKHTKKEKKK